MKKKDSKIAPQKLRSSYITTIVSISLVLFLLSLFGLLVLKTNKLSDYIKENLGFSIILKEESKEIDIILIQKHLDASVYVKSTEYISREQAAEELREDLGEDFIDFLGYNPLLSSINVSLHADYANPDSLINIENDILSLSQVKEVFYQKSLVHLVNDNVRKISIIILLFSTLLLFISIALINNTIRLSIYSKRFIINAMQLVGATYGFIRKPFLLTSLLHGILGGLVAFGLLTAVIFFANKEMPEIFSLKDFEFFGLLFGLIILFGIIISVFSTFFAVNKFLKMKSDQLFY